MSRLIVFGAALLFIGVFAALTIAEIAAHGLNTLTVISALVLGLIGTGVIGALRTPPER